MMLTIVIVAALAINLAQCNPVSSGSRNLWQRSGKFQGDMMLRPEQRNGLVDKKFRWPDAVIPYEFSDDFSESEKQFVMDTLEDQYSKTCVSLRPRSIESDYVYVTGNTSGCWSYVGRVGGKQLLNLQKNGCLLYSTVVHEFMHAFGFHHQQSATDRDDWVDIFWENIDPKQYSNFVKYDANTVTSFGEKYDYYSVLHYDKLAFSNNGKPTILAKSDPSIAIGTADRLSEVDIRKLNKMYGCE